MKHQEFIDQVCNTAEQSRTELINLIADVCRQNGGEIKFKYYSCACVDENFGEDCETIETDIYGAKLYDDKDLVFITENGADEEDAMAYSFDELYNIAFEISELI